MYSNLRKFILQDYFKDMMNSQLFLCDINSQMKSVPTQKPQKYNRVLTP